MALVEVIDAYDRAWNEPRDDERRRLLTAALTDDCELVDPTGRFRGREAIIERLGGFSERFPGARVNITTSVDQHHEFARYGWMILGADGQQVLEGIDVVEIAKDGRLQRIVMLFGPLRHHDEAFD